MARRIGDPVNPDPVHPTPPAKASLALPKWEKLTEEFDGSLTFKTARLATPGGWLYRTYVRDTSQSSVSVLHTTFVPDPTNLASKW